MCCGVFLNFLVCERERVCMPCYSKDAGKASEFCLVEVGFYSRRISKICLRTENKMTYLKLELFPLGLEYIGSR